TSAGGPEAVSAVLRNLPTDSPAAVVVVQQPATWRTSPGRVRPGDSRAGPAEPAGKRQAAPRALRARSVPSSSLLLRRHPSPDALGANDSAFRATKSRTLVAGLPVIASTSCVRRS